MGLADRGGWLCLVMRNYGSAAALLSLAEELDGVGEPGRRGARLVDLAAAADGLGDVARARDLLGRAAALGELAGDPALVVRAAVTHAMPLNWSEPDPRSVALLRRAEAVAEDDAQLAVVQAARGQVEMFIPVTGEEGHRLAWVTRPGVAQPLTEDALARSTGMPDEARAVVLQAWRATHRSPAALTRRCEVSREAGVVAQRLSCSTLRPVLQVESAVWIAVDALESGDRPRHEEAVAVAQWVAQRDGNPRLRWRADSLSAGAAHLDGDLERAERYRDQARAAGQHLPSIGWLAADLLLMAQGIRARNDPDELAQHLVDGESPGLGNPLGRAVAAYAHAAVGSAAVAADLVRTALDQLDPEANYLLVATRAADAALLIGDEALLRRIAAILEPWRSHTSVDNHGWWCDGPVASWLTRLHERLGPGNGSGPAGLTPREVEVLGLIAGGATNRQIADVLAYSLGTVRADTSSIYRKLGTSGRADTVAVAAELGLLARPGLRRIALDRVR